MCVILNLPARVEFPFDKLRSACMANSDGWGILIKDRGKIEMHKIYDGKPNNPDTIMKSIEDAKELERYVHLRYSTHGKVNTENCHPFLITDPIETVQYFLMHNGVFGSYGSHAQGEGKSDTWNFNEILLKPLFDRVTAFTDKPLEDSFLKYMLKRECGSGNRVLIASSREGEDALMVGGEWFRDDEGWYASNNYYFNRSQRDAPFRGPYTAPTGTRTGTSYLQRIGRGSSGGTTGEKQDNICALPKPKIETLSSLKDNLDKKHFSVLEQDVFDIWGIETLEDVHEYSLEDIVELAKTNAKAVALMLVYCLSEIENYKAFDEGIDSSEDAEFIETEYEEIHDRRALG